MNWKLIFSLSIFGLAMGLATVWYIPSSIEPFFWLAIFVVSAYFIAKHAGGRYFLHGLLTSLANSFWVTAAHAAFFYTYIVTHPEYLQMTNGLSPDLAGHPRRLMLAIGPITGIISGIVLGFFAWVASRLINRNTQ